MTENHKLTDQERAERRVRFKEAVNLQHIEGNPLTNEEIAMFEMFDREGWTDEQCTNYINQRIMSNQQLKRAAE